MEIVSVIIPAYNAERFLHRCMDSILCQTYPELEIILINDGSKDNTLRLCREYEAKDARVRLIDQQNKGVAATRNTGLEAAKGEFLLFVDADDWIEPDMIASMLDAIRGEQTADIAFCGHDFAEKPSEVERSKDTHSRELWDEERQQQEFVRHKRMTGMLWNKLMRSSLFEAVRFDPAVGYGEDAQALWKVLKHSRCMVVMDETLYHHVMEEQSISHQKYSPRKFSSVKVWNEIEADVRKNHPQWVRPVRERQLLNAALLCYEMRTGGYKNKEEKRALRKLVRKNLGVVFGKNGLSTKMKLYAFAVALGL